MCCPLEQFWMVTNIADNELHVWFFNPLTFRRHIGLNVIEDVLVFSVVFDTNNSSNWGKFSCNYATVPYSAANVQEDRW